MPYKISGTKSETARIIIFKESDWSVESNTIVSGSGSYEVDSLVTGDKLIVARTNEGELLGYGNVSAEYYTPPGRGVFSMGDTIDYITISTTGNSTYFGDHLSYTTAAAATSNGSNNRGLFAGNQNGSNVISYIDISTPGNAVNFGDLTITKQLLTATSNGVNDRGIFAGGSVPDVSNIIDHVTVSSIGDATDFGDLTQARYGLGGTSNGTNNRGVFGGGRVVSRVNTMDYITDKSTVRNILKKYCLRLI